MVQGKVNYVNWRFTQMMCRLREEMRMRVNNPASARLALAGAFHETNLGDIALRRPFEKILMEAGKKFTIQNLYRFNRYHVSDKILITGGATGVLENVKSLYQRYAANPKKVAMSGMDFGALADLKEEHVDFLKQCAYLSLRSRDQFNQLKGLGLDRVVFAYDNAFALAPIVRLPKRGKVIGFNMLNLFMTWDGKQFTPGTPLLELYKRSNPDAEYQVKKVGPAYIDLFNRLVKHWTGMGYELEHVPFTPEDDFFARSFLKSSKVKFLRYSMNPEAVIRRISSFERFYSSRFHAAIFGFLSGTPTVPFLYSKKCADLINDMHVEMKDLVWRNDLVNAYSPNEEKFLAHNGVVISDEALRHYQESAAGSVRQALNNLQVL